jgi:hypothetical protein
MESENPQKEYLKILNDKEKKAYEIAKGHLETSFSLEKSIGYQEWKKNNEKEK